MRSSVWVISGPAGVGKGTLVARLKELHPDIVVSVSATTRSPRPGEVNGQSYYFVDDAEFDRLIATGELLEWAEVHGAARYGTPRGPVLAAVDSGHTVILEIDLQGAEQVRHTMPQARRIFIAPPSWEELVRRLKTRGTETPDQQRRRLETAKHELASAPEFDFVVVNREVDTAVQDLVALIGL
ncbi:MAG: guanylate kinase [Propionibacteriaceae bacterium]|nr:guanylate kinase [Propionibacteriaceae bacterium]